MSEWLMVKLGEVCRISIGKTPARKEPRYWGDGLPWLSIKDMNQGPLLNTTSETITNTALSELNISPYPAGTVLFSFKLSIGKVGITTKPMFTNEAIAAIEPHNINSLDKPYLAEALRFIGQSLEGNAAVMGITLNKKSLAEINIPLPPLEEQKRIAEILGKVTRVADLVQSEIFKTEYLTSELLMQLIRNVTKKKPLGMITLSKPDYGISQSSMPYNPSIGRYVRITDIGENGELYDKAVSPKPGENPLPAKKLLQPGDLIIARSGATVGKAYLHYRNKTPHWFAGYLIRFTIDPEIISPEIVFDYTKTTRYRAWIDSRKQTVAQPNISAQIYSQELQIPIPTQDAQKAYLNKRKEIYVANKLLHQKLALLQELQRSLSTRAFAGLL